MTVDDRLVGGASSGSSLPPNKSSGDIGELKPCPWCGSTASRVRIMSRDAIQCDGENCGVIKRTPDEWNTRAPDPESAAEIERLRREVEQWAAQSLKEDDCRKSWQARALAAESSLSEAVKAEREACAKVAEAKAVEFLSPEYATGQPFSSFNERFACEQVATAIRSRAAVLEQK